MKKILMIACYVLITVGSGLTHVQSPYLLEGCGSCHVGHGVSSEPMLAASQEEFCYQCHGSDEKRSEMITAGKLAATASLVDMEPVFNKTYRHPVEEGSGHDPREQLPKLSASKVAHAECVDCHNPHQRIQPGEKLVYEVPGYSLSGQYLETSLNEYEVCFKCHVDVTGFGDTENNVLANFSLTYASQHPVTKPVTGGKAVSLSKSLGGSGKMKCSDCHTNNDPNGPQGPHGSDYRFMLSGNYEIGGTVDESPFAYEFCYGCHDRSSLLSNESFPYHREHIVGDPLNNIKGTSCYTCHASHSSRTNENLIRFNKAVVGPETTTGMMRYSSYGVNSGECYVNCHGRNHNAVKY